MEEPSWTHRTEHAFLAFLALLRDRRRQRRGRACRQQNAVLTASRNISQLRPLDLRLRQGKLKPEEEAPFTTVTGLDEQSCHSVARPSSGREWQIYRQSRKWP